MQARNDRCMRGSAGPRCLLGVQQHGVHAVALCQRRSRVAMGEQHTGPRISEHGVQARRWDVAIQRQVSATGFEHGQQRDEQIDATRQTHRDHAFRHDAQPDQMMGELVGASVEVGVAQFNAIVHQGDGVGRVLRLCFDRAMQIAAAIQVAGGGVEAFQFGTFFGG